MTGVVTIIHDRFMVQENIYNDQQHNRITLEKGDKISGYINKGLVSRTKKNNRDAYSTYLNTKQYLGII